MSQSLPQRLYARLWALGTDRGPCPCIRPPAAAARMLGVQCEGHGSLGPAGTFPGSASAPLAHHDPLCLPLLRFSTFWDDGKAEPPLCASRGELPTTQQHFKQLRLCLYSSS